MTDIKATRRDVLAGGLAIAAASVAPHSEAKEMSKENYRCYELGDQSGIGAISMTSRELNDPGPGQVVIRTKAAALNYRDLLFAAGQYGQGAPTSRIPLSDGAGDVVAVGYGVTHIQPGDRVTAPHFVNWLDGEFEPSVFAADLGISADGWLSEMVTLPARSLVKLPDGMRYESAAALGVAGITAWRVLEVLGEIKSGDTVLTLGTGGVSIMALQIASINGARVVITSSSNDKLELAKRLGADVTINYRETPDWENAVREATGGRGADIVVETVGAATLAQSIAACAPNARIGLLGVLAPSPREMPDLIPMYGMNITVQGVTSGSRRMLEHLLRASAANGMQPHVDKVFGFDQVIEAYEYLKKAGHVGKVLISAG